MTRSNCQTAAQRVGRSVEEALLDRARREYDRERTAVMRHSQMCAWCADSPCPMALAVRRNAEAYGRHLAALAHEAAQREGIAWA